MNEEAEGVPAMVFPSVYQLSLFWAALLERVGGKDDPRLRKGATAYTILAMLWRIWCICSCGSTSGCRQKWVRRTNALSFIRGSKTPLRGRSFRPVEHASDNLSLSKTERTIAYLCARRNAYLPSALVGRTCIDYE
jgi:hypothetical protein